MLTLIGTKMYTLVNKYVQVACLSASGTSCENFKAKVPSRYNEHFKHRQ